MKNVKDFHENKKALSAVFLNLRELHGSMKKEMKVNLIDEELFERIEQQLLNDQFIIAVVGVIKRGKSTLLNALLEADHEILPTDVTPETARLSYLQYGEKPRAIVHLTDDKSVEISLDELAQYTSAAGSGKKGNERLIKKTKYAEIFFPNKYLENDVVIVDTPGVDDPDPSRSEVTEKFISRADAAIFLIDATEGGLKDFELKFIRSRILSNGNHKGIMVVINKIGALRPRQLAELPGLTADTKKKLDSDFHIDVPVFEVDAKYAWDGKIKKDDELYARSKFGAFLAALEKMLIETKGAILLGKRSSEVKYEVLKPIHQHLEYEMHASNHTVDELKRELQKLDADIDKQKALFKRVKSEYSKKVANLASELENDVRQKLGRVNVSEKSVQENINSFLSSAMTELEKSVSGRIHRLLTAYKGELGAGNIKVESIDFTIDYPQLDPEDFVSTRTETRPGSVKQMGVRAGMGVGFVLFGPLGALIGAAAGGWLSTLDGTTHTIKEFDVAKFSREFESLKRKIIKIYSDRLDSQVEAFDEKISEWLRQQSRSLQSKRNTVEKKKESQEVEHIKFIEKVSGFLTQANACESSLDRISKNAAEMK